MMMDQLGLTRRVIAWAIGACLSLLVPVGEGETPDMATTLAVAERARGFQQDAQLADAHLLYFFAAREGHAPSALRLGSGFDPLYFVATESLMDGPDPVQALRDPDGANLDRLQIVKGWLDADGKTHEKVYDVAVSGGRTIGANGTCSTPVGNTVDVEAANWTNTIGASELGTVWTDPDFDPDQSAFYYARVLEIPTPRWVVYDAFRFGVELPEEAETTHQERAYTSPIWYTSKS